MLFRSIASMNHILSTPATTVKNLMDTNFTGTVLFCREVAKLMMRKKTNGKIVNFSTVASVLLNTFDFSPSSPSMVIKILSQHLM